MDLLSIEMPDVDWPKIDLPKLLSRFDAMTGALVVWGAMLAVIVLFLLVAAVISWRGFRRQNRADAAASAVPPHLILTPAERAHLRADAAELIRQAAATAAAAKAAVSTVEMSRIQAEVAHRARETAWLAFDEAQKAYEEARSEINRAHEADDRSGPAGEGLAGAEGRREMTRAALAAFRRGDLSVDQLGAVFRQASGWDPLMELHAREVELRRSAESRARRLFQAAAAAERMANQAADIAVIAAHALAEEAVEVAAEAEEAREILNAMARFSTIPARQPSAKRKAAPRKRPTVRRAVGAKAVVRQLPARVPRQRPRPELVVDGKAGPTKELSEAV